MTLDTGLECMMLYITEMISLSHGREKLKNFLEYLNNWPLDIKFTPKIENITHRPVFNVTFTPHTHTYTHNDRQTISNKNIS